MLRAQFSESPRMAIRISVIQSLASAIPDPIPCSLTIFLHLSQSQDIAHADRCMIGKRLPMYPHPVYPLDLLFSANWIPWSQMISSSRTILHRAVGMLKGRSKGDEHRAWIELGTSSCTPQMVSPCWRIGACPCYWLKGDRCKEWGNPLGVLRNSS